VDANINRKVKHAASRGFFATARLSCFVTCRNVSSLDCSI